MLWKIYHHCVLRKIFTCLDDIPINCRLRRGCSVRRPIRRHAEEEQRPNTSSDDVTTPCPPDGHAKGSVPGIRVNHDQCVQTDTIAIAEICVLDSVSLVGCDDHGFKVQGFQRSEAVEVSVFVEYGAEEVGFGLGYHER